MRGPADWRDGLTARPHRGQAVARLDRHVAVDVAHDSARPGGRRGQAPAGNTNRKEVRPARRTEGCGWACLPTSSSASVPGTSHASGCAWWPAAAWRGPTYRARVSKGRVGSRAQSGARRGATDGGARLAGRHGRVVRRRADQRWVWRARHDGSAPQPRIATGGSIDSVSREPGAIGGSRQRGVVPLSVARSAATTLQPKTVAVRSVARER